MLRFRDPYYSTRIHGKSVWPPGLLDDSPGRTIRADVSDASAIRTSLYNQPSAVGQGNGALGSTQAIRKDHGFSLIGNFQAQLSDETNHPGQEPSRPH